MDNTILIKTGNIVIKGPIKKTPLADKVYRALPFTARAITWGKEIYFEIPVSSGIDEAVKEVNKGDIAYWPEGRCLCLFFGPTPISKGETPIPASAVEVIGNILSDYAELETVSSGETITVTKEPQTKNRRRDADIHND